MRTHSDSINVCLVTNRGCNLRCKHCYIEPELLASKNFLSDEHYRMVYQRIFELFELDGRTTEINLESLGGEPTFLPYEYWERNLPFSLEMSQKFFEVTGRKSPFILNTNMIVRDPRYFDLFKKYSQNDDFELFISWEPDTQRYGSRDKLFKKYVNGINQLGTGFRTLSLVATKKLIEMGAQRIVDEHVVPHNFQDIAVAMLFQFGSGKQFFEDNMPTFGAISQFYIDLAKALPEVLNCDGEQDVVTLSPYEEVKQSLLQGRPFQFMGNDHFDLEVEPDGTTSFNSSMTGSEAQMPARIIHVSDDLWGIKVLFENTPMLNKKLNGRYDFCRQCKYQRYCLGGYYHYKLLDRVVVDDLRENGEGDCPGYKKLWDHVSDEFSAEIRPVYEANYFRSMQTLSEKQNLPRTKRRTICDELASETQLSLDGYTTYLQRCLDTSGVIRIDREKVFSKSIDERLWFYDSLGIDVVFDEKISTDVARGMAVQNIVYGNYKNMKWNDAFIVDWINANPSHLLSKDITFALMAIKGMDSVNIGQNEGKSQSPDGLVVDDRNTELFQWAHFTGISLSDIEHKPDSITLTLESHDELALMIEYAVREAGMRKLLNAQ
jgi:hypothetical protein